MVDLEASECRLCGRSDEITHDILEKPQQGSAEKSSLAERLDELLHIKVTASDSLSKRICRQCLKKIDGFNDFIRSVHAHDLKHRIRRPGSENAKVYVRPGLNDNPGEFVLEEGAVLYHIDPFEEISSDDDFSESDSEGGEEALDPKMPAELEETLPTVETNNTLNEFGGYSVPTQSIPVDGHLNVGAPTQTFLCQYCDMAFTEQAECTQHERSHDSLNPLACGICPWRTANRQSLIFHIREMHGVERPYICKLCNKGFCRRSDLKKHTIVHTGVRPYSCHVCAKSFSRNTNLKKHIRIHSSIKPHVCQQCPRSFTTYAELLSHARTHSTLKSYQCSQCPATFARHDKLQQHIQNHLRQDHSNSAGSSNFNQREDRVEGGALQENQVLSTFAEAPYRNSILAAQLQQRPATSKSAVPKQTNSRTIACNICFKVFTRERDLQRHQALHIDKLLTCKQCGQEFSRREKLVRHEQEQHAPKYPCTICFTIFYNEDALNEHLKVHQLQQSTEATMASGSSLSAAVNPSFPGLVPPPPPPLRPVAMGMLRPSQADLSFYSQMVPTMNLGFYSETRPENNGF